MNEKISVYENIKEVKNGYTITVKTALDRIKTGKSKELLLDIRKAKTKKEKNALKANLPSVTFSGTFTERNDESLKEASGYMVLDFDDVKSVEAKKKELSNNSYVFACWESPSGNGVKALIKIANPKKFKEHFKEVEKEFKGIDPSGKNISRVCYESFDPDIYINQNAKVFSKVPQQDGYTVKNWDSVNKALRKIEDSIEGEKHDVRIRISYLFGGWVASGEMTYDDAHRLLINAVLKNTEDPELAIKDVEDSLREGMKSPCSMTKQNEILSMRVGVGKLWVTMTDVAKEVEEFQRKGYERGESCGFSSADDYISFLPSAVTYIYGAPYCFEGSQLVITKDGMRPISELNNGDLVKTYNHNKKEIEFAPVTGTSVNESPSKRLIEVKLKNGKTITCTEDHRFYDGNEYVHIIDLMKRWNVEEDT